MTPAGARTELGAMVGAGGLDKRADVEHIYAKLGVSTRVGAALFAMRHDLPE
jgi:hypothetical protein